MVPLYLLRVLVWTDHTVGGSVPSGGAADLEYFIFWGLHVDRGPTSKSASSFNIKAINVIWN